MGATKNIEGTGVIDMRYENPSTSPKRPPSTSSPTADSLGVSRGSPEPAQRGWEAFGYRAEQPNGADMARAKFEQFLTAIDGYGVAEAAPAEEQYPRMYQPGTPLPVFPHSPGLRRHVWWGAGSHATAEQAARDGVNLMSSTLVSEADGSSLGDLQAEQIARYRAEWVEAGHDWTPRVSVSRSVFPIVDDRSREMFGLQATGRDQIGSLGEGTPVTFGRTYAAEPDVLIDQLRADAAVMAADTLMLTIPNQMGSSSTSRSCSPSPSTSPRHWAGSRRPRDEWRIPGGVAAHRVPAWILPADVSQVTEMGLPLYTWEPRGGQACSSTKSRAMTGGSAFSSPMLRRLSSTRTSVVSPRRCR